MDDWRNDTTDVRYYALFGKQIGSYHTRTIGSVQLTSTGMITTSVEGDGTVPLVSAARLGNSLNYNKSNVHCSLSETHVFTVADRCQMITANQDGLHNGILASDVALSDIMAYLADSR